MLDHLKRVWSWVQRAPVWAWAALAGIVLGARWRRTRALRQVARIQDRRADVETARGEADATAHRAKTEADTKAREDHAAKNEVIDKDRSAVVAAPLDDIAAFVNETFDD